MRVKLLTTVSMLFMVACSPSKNIGKSAKQNVIDNDALSNAHVGISIYEPATGKYLYNYQGDKYFVPASNTKIPTCYAAMKYLGDSLVGAMVEEKWNGIYLYGTGDPTFLDQEFKFQPVWSYLQSKKGTSITLIRKFTPSNNASQLIPVYGSGWSWNDYDEDYMAERSFFPMYGNVARFFGDANKQLQVIPGYFKRKLTVSANDSTPLRIKRELNENAFVASGNISTGSRIAIPFKTGSDFGISTRYIPNTVDSLLSDTLKVIVKYAEAGLPEFIDFKKIHSQPTDSLLKPMMHRSDNFFAEQSLLMVSNERLGVMNDAKIIDTLLKTDFKDLPQQPKWVDGCGLSRYNLFTPQDMVAILNKMQSEFGMQRVKEILATGGEGTLSNYYKPISGYIYAKTGTLSGVVALSGFLYTKKNKLLIFSVLVNNHNSSATQVRRAVEKFIIGIRENY